MRLIGVAQADLTVPRHFAKNYLDERNFEKGHLEGGQLVESQFADWY